MLKMLPFLFNWLITVYCVHIVFGYLIMRISKERHGAVYIDRKGDVGQDRDDLAC